MKTNVFAYYMLTLITLGIYAVWHRVRTTNMMYQEFDKLNARLDVLMATGSARKD